MSDPKNVQTEKEKNIMNLVEDRETIIELDPSEYEFFAVLHKIAYKFERGHEELKQICFTDEKGGHSTFQMRLKPIPRQSKIQMRTWVRK